MHNKFVWLVGVPKLAELIVLQISIVIGIIGADQVLNFVFAESEVAEGVLSIRYGDLPPLVSVELMEEGPQLCRTANKPNVTELAPNKYLNSPLTRHSRFTAPYIRLFLREQYQAVVEQS